MTTTQAWRFHRRLPVLLFAAWALGPALVPAAHAGTLYKCQPKTGAVSIQSEPCPKDSTQVWAREANPEAPLSPEQQAQIELRRRQDSEDARALAKLAGTLPEERPVSAPPPAVPAPAPTVETAPAPKGPCRQAHELSDAIRAKPWLEMSDLQLRRLDDWVAGQCRNPEEPGAAP